jgi:hypothetical protein
VLPHGLALLLLLVALIEASPITLLAALAMLTGFSLPLVANGLWASLEAGQRPLAPLELPAG